MHIMIDLETMGTRPNAPIIAIGAVAFGSGYSVQEKHAFYRNVGLKSSIADGAEIDPDTLMWWLGQSEEARGALLDAEQVSVKEALEALDIWIHKEVVIAWGGNSAADLSGVWGNGATFDNVLMRETYNRAGLECPWPFWLDKCYRTVKGAYPSVTVDRKGTHHNAADDAISQAHHLMAIDEVAGGIFVG